MFGHSAGTVFFKITTNRGAFTKEMKSAAGSAESIVGSSMKKVGGFIASAFAVSKVVSFGKECVRVASETQSAWTGLNSILSGQGQSFNQANKFIKAYIKDGLVPLNNAVTAYKNLSARGYTTEQIEKVMTALKDSAAFGRQSSYSYGEAIQTATEGLKNENSILVDNAGVTKNVAKMWEDYAKSIGTTTNKLTQQQKIQAEVNGIIAETKWQTGDAAKYADTYAGRTARLTASLTTLKTSIGNIIIPVANLFIPAIQSAIDITQRFTDVLGNTLSALGVNMFDTSQFSNVSSAADIAADSIVNTGTAAEAAAKKAKKAFASYDEINVLNKSSADTSSAGGGGLNTSAAPINSLGAVKEKSAFNTDEIENTLVKVTAIVSGSLLALGAILAFSGANIPLGIALMAVGAAGLASAVAIDWKLIDKNITGAIDVVGAALAGSAIVIGAILAFSGANIPLGVALLSIGTLGMATAATLNWNSMENNCKTAVTSIMAVVGGAALAIGAVLAFSGANIPLGIGLIAVGAVSLASAIAVNWNSCNNKIATTITTIGTAVSGALLALGAVLAFSGGNIPLGIALMGAGAVGIASAVAVKWDGMSDKVKNTLSIISAVASGALLAIGTIITIASFNPALGLGLMAAGAVGLAATVAVNWNKMPDSVRKTVTTIGAIAGTAILALGILMVISGVAVPLGLGLIAAGAVSLASAIAPNWNYITDGVSNVFTSIHNKWSVFKAKIDITKTNVKTDFKNFFSDLWADITGIFSKVGTWFRDRFNEAVTGIKNVFNGIPTFFSGIWTKIKDKFTSIGTKIGDAMGGALKKAVNAVMRTIENVVNTPINAINSLIGVINKVPGINLGRLNTFSLPRLAQGGWVAANNPRLAIIGDNRREGEIVTPESKIREQVELALSKMKQTATNAVQTVKLQLELIIRYPDGREVIKQINEAQIQEGRILLEI